MRVVGPVRAELEFHGNARRDAERKVDAKELAPKAGHVLVELFARDYICHFHHNEHE